MDIEQRLYGGGCRFTGVNMFRTSIVGLLLYGVVVLLAHLWAPWAEGVD